MNELTLKEKLLGALIGLVALLLLSTIVVRYAFFDFVENYELSYMFDKRTGKIIPLLNKDGEPKTGYIYSYPFVQSIHRIDLRPTQVCINANSRVLNCKLVRFNKKGLELFIEWHGRGDYDQYLIGEVLRSYAYDGGNLKEYPFLEVLKELKNENYEKPINKAESKDSIK